MRLSRKLVMWGGAAAIAAGGFAFMDSNTVNASSAGEGVGAVTGYTVSGITYTVNDHYYNAGGLGQPLSAVTAVTFLLTSVGTGSASTQPAHVVSYALEANGSHPWGHSLDCTTTGWTNGTSTTTGHGTYNCVFSPVVPTPLLQKLGVEANQ